MRKVFTLKKNKQDRLRSYDSLQIHLNWDLHKYPMSLV